MNLLAIYSRFPDQEACLEHLEHIRFGDDPYCPHCGSVAVARKADGERIGRWNSATTANPASTSSPALFSKRRRIPLQKWFLAVGLIVNAKKSLSSWQLARDLELTQPTAWYLQQRARAAMASEQGEMLQGILEADETYVGGKPRRSNKRNGGGPSVPSNRGRGTKKTPVIGVVERGGKVVAQVADGLKGRDILRFLKKNVDPLGSLLITDEYPASQSGWPVYASRRHQSQRRLR